MTRPVIKLHYFGLFCLRFRSATSSASQLAATRMSAIISPAPLAPPPTLGVGGVAEHLAQVTSAFLPARVLNNVGAKQIII